MTGLSHSVSVHSLPSSVCPHPPWGQCQHEGSMSNKYHNHCTGAVVTVHSEKWTFWKGPCLSCKLPLGLVTSSEWCTHRGHFSRRTHTPASQRWVPMDVTTSQLSMMGS